MGSCPYLDAIGVKHVLNDLVLPMFIKFFISSNGFDKRIAQNLKEPLGWAFMLHCKMQFSNILSLFFGFRRHIFSYRSANSLAFCFTSVVLCDSKLWKNMNSGSVYMTSDSTPSQLES